MFHIGGKKQHSKWIDPLEDANTYVEVFGGACGCIG